MKQLFLYLSLSIAGLSLTSCNSLQTYYQVCEVESVLQQDAHGRYEFNDNACTVSYDFWCNGGNPGFVFHNNSDEILYVDLSKSFFMRNGVAYDYFLNRTISTSASYVEAASASKSGSAYGYWNAIGGLIPGGISVTSGLSSSASKSTTVETAEKCIVAIPPHTSKYFSEYAISSEYLFECGYNTAPSKKEVPTYSYQLVNTPLTFGNYITYRVGNEDKEYSLANDFFINKVSFYHADAAFEEQKVGCPQNMRTVHALKGASPKNFYIRYYRKQHSSFSKQQQGPKGNVKRDDDNVYY